MIEAAQMETAYDRGQKKKQPKTPSASRVLLLERDRKRKNDAKRKDGAPCAL